MEKMPEFKDTPAISREDFMFAWGIALNAGTLKMPVENPAVKTFGIESEDGDVDNYSFTDNATNRSFLALSDHLGDDSLGFFSFSFRYRALSILLSDERISQFTRKTNKQTEIHTAVLYAAAKVKLTKKGKFPVKLFNKAVQEIINSEEFDFDENDQ